jgi:hypothetical protein
MSRQTIRDNRFKPIGYIDTDRAGKQTARNGQFRLIGYFDPAQNITRDSQFRIVAYGNVLSRLL